MNVHTDTPENLVGRKCALLIPVGPHPADLWRAIELVNSVVFWEPTVRWFVFVDDGEQDRGLSQLKTFPRASQAVTLMSPRRGQGRGWSGGLVAGVLAGFSWIRSNTDADFVLKLDTDALVIGPFAQAVLSALKVHDDAGIIGTVGPSCNPAIEVDLERESHLVRMHRLVPPSHIACQSEYADLLQHEGFVHIPADKLRMFDTIRPVIRSAIANGYLSSVYCQGGAYAVSRRMIDLMGAADYYSQLHAWIQLPFCEDMTMSLYAHAVNLHIYNYSSKGHPFGVQYRGLPYSPKELVEMDYRIIHSTRNDPIYSEEVIREFFAARIASLP